MVVFLELVEMEQDVLLIFAKENNKKEIILCTSGGILKSKILGNNLSRNRNWYSKN